MNGTIIAGSSSGSAHFQARNSGSGVAMFDVLVGAEEAGEEPGLALAAPFLLPDLADQILGQVVGELLAVAGDDLDQVGANARLLLELAKRSVERRLAGIEAALRHLPGLEPVIEPLPDPDLALGVDQHDPDGGAIAMFGHAPASFRISFSASTPPPMSSSDEGMARLRLMKPWILPLASRKTTGTPASAQAAA